MLKWISDAIHRSFLRRDVKLKADSLAVVEALTLKFPWVSCGASFALLGSVKVAVLGYPPIFRANPSCVAGKYNEQQPL